MSTLSVSMPTRSCLATAGYNFGAALLHIKVPSVKERSFTAPQALHAKRPQPWHANQERPDKKLKKTETEQLRQFWKDWPARRCSGATAIPQAHP